MEKISEQEIVFVKKIREETDLSWQEITDKFNKKFKNNKGMDGVKKIYYRYGEIANETDFNIRTLQQTHRRKIANSFTAKENRVILDYIVKQEDILESIKSAVKETSKIPIKIYKPTKSSKKENMTMELMFSDVHYGKKTDKVNLVEIRRRVQKIARVVVDEINRESKNFNVHRLILSMIGDIIEHADFHGKESMKSSEFGTSRQVFEAVNSIYVDLIIPIASTGIDVDILAVTGNHDRLDENKTYNNPGEENLTYVIYKTLEFLASRDNLKNVKFSIAKGSYASIGVYQNTLLIEHGDEAKNLNRDTLNNLLSKRQNQLNKIVDFYRIGHWHEATSYGQGRIMVNGSVPGQDSYADVKGFCSEAIQILNYYVETKTRPSCFFRSFPIYLEKK